MKDKKLLLMNFMGNFLLNETTERNYVYYVTMWL
jgi:hypothetical protein